MRRTTLIITMKPKHYICIRREIREGKLSASTSGNAGITGCPDKDCRTGTGIRRAGGVVYKGNVYSVWIIRRRNETAVSR